MVLIGWMLALGAVALGALLLRRPSGGPAGRQRPRDAGTAAGEGGTLDAGPGDDCDAGGDGGCDAGGDGGGGDGGGGD